MLIWRRVIKALAKDSNHLSIRWYLLPLATLLLIVQVEYYFEEVRETGDNHNASYSNADNYKLP